MKISKPPEEVPRLGMKRALVSIGDAGRFIELAEPLGDGAIARALEKYGEGVHLVALAVEDIAAATAEMKRNGARVIEDGSQVFIAVTGNRHWTALCELLGFNDWRDAPEFNTNRKRSANKGVLAERIKAAVLQYTFDEITRKLGEKRIPYAPVNTPLGLVSEQHLNEGNRWLNLDVAGHKLKVSKLPISMSETQDFEVREPPGTIGNHTDRILAEIGYSAAEIEAFKAEKVVATTATMFTDLPTEG